MEAIASALTHSQRDAAAGALISVLEPALQVTFDVFLSKLGPEDRRMMLDRLLYDLFANLAIKCDIEPAIGAAIFVNQIFRHVASSSKEGHEHEAIRGLMEQLEKGLEPGGLMDKIAAARKLESPSFRPAGVA